MPDGQKVQARLQQALHAALRARDAVAVSVLRSAAAAIANAEAVVPPATAVEHGHPHVAGSVAGVGAAEAPRRALTDAQVGDIIRAEISDRQDAADLYERAGHADRATRLRHEADVLAAALSADPPSAR